MRALSPLLGGWEAEACAPHPPLRGLPALATEGEGREGLAPHTPRREGPPLGLVFPSAGCADTDFPRVSNTTSRHPFDTLVTGMAVAIGLSDPPTARGQNIKSTSPHIRLIL